MPKSKYPFKRSEVLGIVKRFMKPEAYVATRDIPLFYKAYALFPDEKFWRNYKLDFQLNCMAWFLSEDGKTKLKTDLAVFNLDIPSQSNYNMETEKVGEDVTVVRPKTSISNLFK